MTRMGTDRMGNFGGGLKMFRSRLGSAASDWADETASDYPSASPFHGRGGFVDGEIGGCSAGPRGEDGRIPAFRRDTLT